MVNTFNFKSFVLNVSLTVFLFFSFNPDVISQIPAFPGAEGFGKYTTGGRGGKVIEVTNLNDRGPGSLRAAVEATGPRTVVFTVSGTIYLESDLRIKNNDITIAGQTAPGDGITLAYYSLVIDASNVILRYIRSRLGDVKLQESDAFTCREEENIIIDHCSFSWSVDEVASCYLNRNFTMQWCIIAESMYNSVHSKGAHGYGGIWGGSRASFHHNLIAHNTSRNPRFNGARYIGSPWDELVDFRNNLIYNWGFNSCYGGEPSEIDGIKARINMVNNYYKYGPATNTSEIRYRILSPDPYNGQYSYWYIDGNKTEGYPEVQSDNWLYGVQGVTESEKNGMKSELPFEYEIDTNHTADEAFWAVIENAGLNIPRLDTVDKRILDEALHGYASFGGATRGAGTGIIDSQEDVGGWPDLFSYHYPIDSDHDGMPDDWETDMGLDKNNPDDRNLDLDSDGYTNLEEYLNGITATLYFIHPPGNLESELTDIRKISLTWKDNSGDELGFYLERNNGSGYVPIDTLDANVRNYQDSLLNFGTTYSYRIRSFNQKDTSIYAVSQPVSTPGETDPPLPSSFPQPGSGALSVPVDLLLSWKAGVGASEHVLYLGTTNPPALIGTTTDTSWQLTGLEYGKKYYWRVNESNEFGETPGELWNFVTEINMTDQMVAHWQFETISTVFDSTIFANHGSYYNFFPYSLASSGAIGKAIKFNGTNQYIRIPDNPVLDFGTNSFSIAFWMKQDPSKTDFTKEYPYILKGSRFYNEPMGYSGKSFEVFYRAAQNEMRFVLDDNLQKSTVAAPDSFFIINQWVHLTAIRDTEKDELRIYANGTLVNTATDLTSDLSQGEDIYLGYNPALSYYFNGVLDDMRLYNYVLPDDEITSLVGLGPLGVNEPLFSTTYDLQVWPNPAGEILYLNFGYPDTPGYAVSIWTPDGKCLFSQNFKNINMGESKGIDLEGFLPGLYILNVRTENGYSFRKMIVRQ